MTTEEAGKRITVVAVAMSALVVAIAGLRFLLAGMPLVRFGQAVFLMASAWILVAGLMRLLTSGMLFLFSAVFDAFEDAMPSSAGFFHFLRRAFGGFCELFLVAGMFYLILTGLAVAFEVGVTSSASSWNIKQPPLEEKLMRFQNPGLISNHRHMSRSLHITKKQAARRYCLDGDTAALLQYHEKQTVKELVKTFRPIHDEIHPSDKTDNKLRGSAAHRVARALQKGKNTVQ